MKIIEGEKTMKNFKYQCNMALREHMLSGHRVTLIEALLICFATNNHSNFFKSISFNLVDESTAKIVSNLS